MEDFRRIAMKVDVCIFFVKLCSKAKIKFRSDNFRSFLLVGKFFQPFVLENLSVEFYGSCIRRVGCMEGPIVGIRSNKAQKGAIKDIFTVCVRGCCSKFLEQRIELKVMD